MTKEPQKVLQLISEEELTILKKNTTKIRFDNKMANTSNGGFLMATKLYNNPSGAAILGSNKWNMEGKLASDPEGKRVNKLENDKTKQLETWRIHVNNIHAKLSQNGEDIMCVTSKKSEYSVMGVLYVHKYCNRENIKHK